MDIFGFKKSRPRQSSVSNSDLSERSVPYDRLAPSPRTPIPIGTLSQGVRGSAIGSVISAPITNPTLTADGTDSLSSLNRHISDASTSSTTLASLTQLAHSRRRETDTSSLSSSVASYRPPSQPLDKRTTNMSDFGSYAGSPYPPPTPAHRQSSSAATVRSEGGHRGSRYASSSSSESHGHLPHLHLRHSSAQDEFDFPRPRNPSEIEAMFERVKMTLNLPDANVDLDQKWQIVHEHERMRWQEAKRGDQRRLTSTGNATNVISSKDSPEWYLKKFMDQTVTIKHVASLIVSLRTLPIQ